MEQLIKSTPDNEYFLLFDQIPPDYWQKSSGTNIHCITVKPLAKNAATRAIWYDLLIPPILSKQKINLFIGACAYISLRTKVPQVLMLHDMASGEAFPTATGWNSHWYKRRLPAMLQKAAHRFTPSRAITKEFAPNSANLHYEMLPFCPFDMAINNITENQKQLIKQKLTGGTEFFYCEEGWNTMERAVELLLAFSAFKKRMQTGMKLVLAGQGPAPADWQEKLSSYRYREDVITVSDNVKLKERIEMLASAYSLVHLPVGAKTRLPEYAFLLNVPVITLPHEVIREIGGNAPLYCTDAPGESLAQNLMRMYKDEKLRGECINAGQLIAKKWDLKLATEAFCQTALPFKG
jgi:glycosyltransferase involved in cell wall biosynthesis